ncbi:ATP-binding protein [Pontiellaceae bacterium B12219]|nr:ATP-binding protein [Pontiellaceae bacterium B12219]
MKLSFKFKIATLSFAVSGALLTTFGITFFAFIYSSGIERMDRELRSLAEVPIRAEHPPEYWKQFGDSLKFIQGESRAERLSMIVRDRFNKVLFQSENARPQFDRLPLPDIPDTALPDEKPQHAHLFLKRNDFNNDGKVTPDEFDGPPDMFRFSDKNKDGAIDLEEAATLRGRGQRPGPRGGPAPHLPTNSGFYTMELPFENWRVGIFRNAEITIVAALNMDSFNAEVNGFRTAFMIAVPLGLLILGFMGWYLAGRAMKPVAAIADTAEGITAKGLDQRIPKVGNDIELERLVSVSNNMLDRLEKSYHQAVRFSADAAHELQTPLTILQGELDNAIQSSVDGSEEQQRYSMLLEELGNLKAVVQKLLLLAHADEGRLNVSPQSVDLSDLIFNATEDLEIMAPELLIETRIQKPVDIQSDPALLNQTIRNMTSNVAKYTAPGGRVVFILEQDENTVRFTLENSAPPIPEEDRPLLFERFHRVEKSRTTTGSGLGLSLAREIARAHGGDLVLNLYKDGMVSFTLCLPV